LFCFPGGGASASLFFSWAQLLPPSIEVGAIQLPGRVPDLDLPADADHLSVTIALSKAIQRYQDRPFAFFGHSLGGLFAFEVARYLREHALLQPSQLFFACLPPPHLSHSEWLLLNHPTEELLAFILASISASLPALQNPENQYSLTFFKLDIMRWKCYHYDPSAPFACPITVFGGLQDPFVHVEHLPCWKVHTTSQYTLQMFPGDHCFFYSDIQPLLQALTQHMMEQPITK
jgi:surfactin synthase thioesterase subunit